MPKAKGKKAKRTKRAPRKHKMIYKCINKSESVKQIHHQEKNEHGAMNNIVKLVPYVSLTFVYHSDLNRLLDISEEPPMVTMSQFMIETRNRAISDKYVVGEEYKELPTSV